MPTDPETGKWKQLPAETAGRMAVACAMKSLAAAYLAEYANLVKRWDDGDEEVRLQFPDLPTTTARQFIEDQMVADACEECILNYADEQTPEVYK